MGIRKATLADAAGITSLLDQLDYPGTASFIEQKIETILNNPLAVLLVYECGEKVAAFIVVDFLPQLGLKGDIA
jgi:hypothetical protein